MIGLLLRLLVWFNYGIVDDFLHEWLIRKNEFEVGEISRHEYFEWKLNWPDTCYYCGKSKSKKKWKQ